DATDMRGLQTKSTLYDTARTLPAESKSKAGALGYNVDDGEGTVKAVKKTGKGIEITFVPTSTQIMTTSCVTTNRIVTFDHAGNPIYYQ
ncbi:hypothetical protein OFC08_31205, partial [Escherichia coli]|nr:hypothetical protein [Escherichia coli]